MGGTLGQSALMLAAMLLAAGGDAAAQQSPPPSPPAQAEAADDEDEGDEGDAIIVTAPPGDQVRIDRRTYTVRDDAAAHATEALDILGRIPSVSVGPSGEIRLLGGTGVTVQLNGQAIPGASVEQVLRSLTGNDIERIEVTTNPPASQSADSSAGIINIITRDRILRGFTGSLTGNVNTLGSTQAGVTPTWARGPMTISGRLNYLDNLGDQSFVRRIENFTAGSVIDESGGGAYDNTQGSANVQFSYRFNPRRRASLSLDQFSVDNQSEQTFTQQSNLGLSNTQTAPSTNEGDVRSAYFTFKETGENQSVLELTSYLASSDFSNRRLSTIVPTVGSTTQYIVAGAQEDTTFNMKLEYERPLGGTRLLEFGASFEQLDQELGNLRQTLTGPNPADYQTTLNGLAQTSAGYVTYQFGLGDWIFQPGLRAENYRREVIGVGGQTDSSETTLFPSLHARHELSRTLNLDLSYSSRIQRPYFGQLDPTVRISTDGLKGNAGNPDLEPTTTDAYEANLTYQNRGSTFSVTFFDRISQDIVSPFTELTPAGVLLTRPVNAGESEQRGLQTILRGPLGEHWRYSLSANFLTREFDVLRGGTPSRRSQFEYDGNAQIEWRDPNQNEPGADQFQFDLQFQGPRATLQGETDEFFLASLTWRRRLTPRLFGTLRWADVFDTNATESSTRTGDAFDHVENQGVAPRVFFTLNYQFGSLTERPPQQDQPPPPPPMQPQPQ